jgi:hypothetical protein
MATATPSRNPASTAPKGRPTPAQKAPRERSAKTEDRIALFQWFLVFAAIFAITAVIVILAGPGDGPSVGLGGHGG